MFYPYGTYVVVLVTGTIVMESPYHKPELRRVSGKSSWYVFITKPIELQTQNNKQIRKSTRTTDRKLAEKRMHGIAASIFEQWDRQLYVDPLERFLQPHWSEKLQRQMGDLRECLHATAEERVTVCLWVMMSKNEWQASLAREMFDHMTFEEAREWKIYLERHDNPYPVGSNKHSQIVQKEVALQTFIAKQAGSAPTPTVCSVTESPAFNATNAPLLSSLRNEWLADLVSWRDKTQKYRSEMATNSLKVIEILGDLPIDQLRQTHGTTLARALDAEGKSNSTIKKYKLSLDRMVDWTLANKENRQTTPPQPWLLTNPLAGFSLAAYGAKKRSYEALPAKQLHALFAQQMSPSDRLLLSILITTGMRLDEAALLTWEQLKTDRNGIRYFDLSMGANVKNDRYSARTVALPDCLHLPPVQTGKLFNFVLNEDGKSSADASKRLNQKYFHPIRNGKNDDRKVVHSLRHTLAGLLRSLQPTPSGEVMDWITGHGEEGGFTQSERVRTYNEDVDVKIKYEIVNRVRHPWLQNEAEK